MEKMNNQLVKFIRKVEQPADGGHEGDGQLTAEGGQEESGEREASIKGSRLDDHPFLPFCFVYE